MKSGFFLFFYLALILNCIHFESDQEALPDYDTNSNKKLSVCIQCLTPRGLILPSFQE